MDTKHPNHPGFKLPATDRSAFTLEPEPKGSGHDPRFPGMDWITSKLQGGGSVPADFAWRSNPKQDHDDKGCK